LSLEHTFDYRLFVGYRGKVGLQEEARRLRATGMTMPDIAEKLGVSRSSVSLWTRDVAVPGPRRRRVSSGRPNRLHDAKLAEIERLRAEGLARIGQLSEREFLVAGAALYAGEGGKNGAEVHFTNADPRMILFFCTWLRRFFPLDESRLRLRLYLHEGLDLDAAERYWSDLTGIPRRQFHCAYRAEPDPTRRKNKYEFGCPAVRYGSTSLHREVMGLVGALLSSDAIPG